MKALEIFGQIVAAAIWLCLALLLAVVFSPVLIGEAINRRGHNQWQMRTKD